MFAFLSALSPVTVGWMPPSPAPIAAAPGIVAAPGIATVISAGMTFPLILPARPEPVFISGASRLA